jgi:hypothetical protein
MLAIVDLVPLMAVAQLIERLDAVRLMVGVIAEARGRDEAVSESEECLLIFAGAIRRCLLVVSFNAYAAVPTRTRDGGFFFRWISPSVGKGA